MIYSDNSQIPTPTSRPDFPIRHNIQFTLTELFTELKSFIREELSEGFRRSELKDHFVLLNAEETDRVSNDLNITTNVLALCSYSPDSFHVIGRMGKPGNHPRPILCRMKAGVRLPLFKELAERLKKTPELSHINVRRAETPKQRHEGYLRRKAAREQPLTPCAPEIKEPTSPIENTREELQLVMPSPQLSVIEPIAHPVQLPTAEPPVSPIPLLDQQSLDHFSESFGKAFEAAMEKAFIEKYGCKD